MTDTRSQFFALLAALVVTTCAACVGGKAPTSPTPAGVCEDPKARNVGQPLPCVYPIVSVVKTLSVSPPSGGNLKFSGPGADVLVEWRYDPYIPGRVAVSSYLSVDCENIIPTTTSGVSGATSGQGILGPAPRPKEWFQRNGITQTKCIINQIEVVDANWRVLEVVTREVVPWVFNLVD